MEFGYFTLSDNHYDNNPRTPNQFVADITEEALYADALGGLVGVGAFRAWSIIAPRPDA